MGYRRARGRRDDLYDHRYNGSGCVDSDHSVGSNGRNVGFADRFAPTPTGGFALLDLRWGLRSKPSIYARAPALAMTAAQVPQT